MSSVRNSAQSGLHQQPVPHHDRLVARAWLGDATGCALLELVHHGGQTRLQPGPALRYARIACLCRRHGCAIDARRGQAPSEQSEAPLPCNAAYRSHLLFRCARHENHWQHASDGTDQRHLHARRCCAKRMVGGGHGAQVVMPACCRLR